MLRRTAAAWLAGMLVLTAMAGCRKAKLPDPVPASASATVAADTGDITPLSEWSIDMVTARNLVRLGEISGATDRFGFDGKIVVQATMRAKPGSHAGSHTFAVKWFDGLNVITEQSAVYDVKSSPFFVAASTSGAVLGAGPHRVELFADGRYLASTQFTVVGR